MPSAAQDPADSAEEGPAAAETVPASDEPVYDEDIAFLSKEFDEIKDFMLDTDGMYETVDTASQCRLKCTENVKCRSYSFSVKGNDKQPGPVCVITKKFVGFDPNWKFYTRTMAVDAFGKLRLMGRFKSFEGMRYIDDNHYRKLVNVNEQQCLEACEQPAPEGPECKAFSYNGDKQLCLLTDDGLRYSVGFTYFERNKRIPGKQRKYEHYELEESQDQAKARSVVERQERDAALKDKKNRLEREEKEDEIKTAKKGAQLRAATVAKESGSKIARQKETQEKMDTRTRLSLKRRKAAAVRGAYMESVAKSQVNVDERKIKLDKHKQAKKIVAMQNHAEKVRERRQTEFEESRENRAKKAKSKLDANLARSNAEFSMLNRVKMLSNMQFQGARLAQRERWSKHGMLTKSTTILIKTEDHWLAQLASVTEELTKAKARLAKVESKLGTGTDVGKFKETLKKRAQAREEEYALRLERHRSLENKRAEKPMSFTAEQQKIPLRPLVVAERRKLEKVTDSKESQELAKAKQDKLDEAAAAAKKKMG